MLVDEISRLSSAILSLQESHALQIQKLEDCLEAKRVQISRLETKVDKLTALEDDKRRKTTNQVSRAEGNKSRDSPAGLPMKEDRTGSSSVSMSRSHKPDGK